MVFAYFVKKRKIIKKGWKIVLVPLTVLILTLSALYISLQSQAVQTFLTRQVTAYFARNLHVNLHVGRVNVSLFNKILLENVWIEDQKSDTLVYASLLSAGVRDVGFRKKFVDIGHVTLENFRVFIQKDSTGRYNFEFLTKAFSSQDTTKTTGWSFSCRNFRLKNSGFVYQSLGADRTQYGVDDINFRIDRFRYSPDSLKFRLASLTLIDSKGFFLNDMSADFCSKNGRTEIRNLSFQTLYSSVEHAGLIIRPDTLPGSKQMISDMELDLDKAKISLADLAFFIPALKGMDQNLEITGTITGNAGNLKAKDLMISTGENTLINCDVAINTSEGMPEPFLFFNLKRSQTDFRDLSKIKLPVSSGVGYLSFPDNFYQAGLITYEGNFTGFLSDFVAYGTIRSWMGIIKSDLSFVPVKDGNIHYNGKVETSGFKLGKLLKTDQLGEISLSGMVDGLFDKKSNNISGNFNGTISDLWALGYNYQNITMDGKISGKRFDGNVNIDDPNLKMYLNGLLNLNEKVPQFDFVMNLKKADLTALHLDTLDTRSDLSFEMAANFSGNNLDNLDGLIQLYNGEYTNQNNTLHCRNLTVNTHLGDQSSEIHLYSDYLNGSITGTYHFSSLFDSFRDMLANYLPALGISPSQEKNSNQFAFELNCTSLDELTSVFIPTLKIGTPFSFRGRIDSNLASFEMNGKIPRIQYNGMIFQNADLTVTPRNKELVSEVSFDEVKLYEGVSLRNLALSVDATGDLIRSKLIWDNQEKVAYRGNIESDFLFSREKNSRYPHIRIEMKPSEIIISDSLWHLSPTTVVIDSTDISVRGFSFRNKQQEIALNGKISKDDSAKLDLTIKQINLESIGNYLKQPLGTEGIANGTISISDFYKQLIFNADLRIAGLKYEGQEFGDVSVLSRWDGETGLINGDMKIEKNKRNSLLCKGTYDPKTNEIDFGVDLDHMSLVLLGTVITETFSNFHGDGTGHVRVHGKFDKIQLDGAVYAKNAGLTIDFTQVTYNLSDSVRFAGDKIIFRNIGVADISGNRGVFNGFIRHDSFANMDYDMTVSSNKILVLNTSMKDNNEFNGKAIARGNLSITGHGDEVKLAGEVTSLPETSVTIILDDNLEVTKYDFIRFSHAGKDTVMKRTTADVASEEGGTEVDLLIYATPEARVQMIYNTQISDQIWAQGEGTLRFGMDKAENITLSGNYVVNQGEYLFTLQDVIKKKFTVEKGGSISWTGDPYKAVLDLKAIYKLKASLYELLVGSIENFSNKQRIPVECKIMLTGDLMRPDINLDIAFPGIEERLRDELQQFFSTQEDMNRQMLSLLVLGKFYTPEYMRGNYESTTTSLLGNTASDLFSNQLSNWLSKINKDVNIGVKYRPGNQLTNDEIELALSTQIFNDRVSINGNIGNNTNQTGSSNNELVGDFEIGVKLTQNGKLELKAYNKSNNNLIYETAPYTQGIGVSYKEDYNTLGELWKQFLNLFRKKKQ